MSYCFHVFRVSALPLRLCRSCGRLRPRCRQCRYKALNCTNIRIKAGYAKNIVVVAVRMRGPIYGRRYVLRCGAMNIRRPCFFAVYAGGGCGISHGPAPAAVWPSPRRGLFGYSALVDLVQGEGVGSERDGGAGAYLRHHHADTFLRVVHHFLVRTVHLERA